ncbi:hypothetical protein [Pseudoduganella sp. R-34]|jgi:hypothetical protein|uniref:hypothetical protein n=1 Tax=unclassified Pseudoduganella TaxID=2637179 RepID=UPI003CEC14B3
MHPLDRPTVQRRIVVSIFGIESDANATYTYIEPVTGESFVQSDTCNMKINRPSVCLFVLDDDASISGWTIKEITAKPAGAPLLPSAKGPFGLSLATYNDHSDDTAVFNYYIHFYNTVTEATFKEDPQEENIPRPR